MVTVMIAASPYPAMGGDAYVRWPVPESYDIRGTYCDYRNSPNGFHTGIDIYGQGHCCGAGCSGLEVYPVGAAMRVMAARFDENYEMYVVAWDYWNPADRVLYHHVTGRYPDELDRCGDYIEDYDLVNSYYPLTHISDYAYDGNPSNDHLHFATDGEARRNPLWDSPDYPHLPYTDNEKPTIEGVAFAEYFGPYDSRNNLEDFAVLPTDRTPDIWDDTNTDIIVWAHDDGGKVGVRGLSYAVTDPGEGPQESDWIPFCDFTQGLPASGDCELVYAFERDGGVDVLTNPDPPNDKLWYIVTNTSGAANSFTDNAWRTPRLVGDETEIAKTVHIRAVDAAGNAETVAIEVSIKPYQGAETPATFWVVEAGDGVVARWVKNSGLPARGYRIWARCGEGGGEMVLAVEATVGGESGDEVYCFEIPRDRSSSECVYRLEAVMDEGVSVPLAWARALRPGRAPGW